MPLTERSWISSRLPVGLEGLFDLTFIPEFYLENWKFIYNMFFLYILFQVRVRHLGVHNNIIMNAIILRKAREAYLIRKAKTIEPMEINKRDEQ